MLAEQIHTENTLSPTGVLEPYYLDFMRRLRSSVKFTESIRQSADWIVANTRDPRREDQPYSFKDHEYQIDICNDDTSEQVTQKPSQVGASELAVRRIAALMGMLSGITTIYTMPSANPAKKFCKERIDPVVANSPALSNILNPDVDNTEMKQFGNNFLHITGTFGAVSAISVPTTILIKDEINFSNTAVLGKFKSRMTHNKPGEALDISFSTPTEPGIGISEKFEHSDKKYYHVLHDVCQQWVILDYSKDCVVVPGFNDIQEIDKERKTILEWEAEDAENPDIDIDNAWFRCPHCAHEVTHENLSVPEKRKWIATRVSPVSGRQIFPHDVPAYNNLPKILRSLGGVSGYELKSDWVNFCLGLPYNDASTKFNVEVFEHKVGKQVDPAEGCAVGTVAGLDVGKNSWFVVGQPSKNKIRTIYAEKIVNSDDGSYLSARTLQLCQWFGVTSLVVDTAPDISAFRAIREGNPEGHTFGCQYVRNRTKKATNFEVDEEEQIVSAYRTGVFNALCQDVNSGVIEFCDLDELATIRDHCDAMSRVTIYNDEGEATYRWINGRKPDHYAHALNYMKLAYQVSMSKEKPPVSVVSIRVKTAKMKNSPPSGSLLN